MPVYQEDIDKTFVLNKVVPLDINDNSNWQPQVPAVSSSTLIWNIADAYSTFYADNNVASLSAPTDVILNGVGNFNMDAGNYTNFRLLTFA